MTRGRRFRRYLFLTVVCFALIETVAVGFNAFRLWCQRDDGEAGLLRYQIDKVRSAAGIDTIFVGDSSLGNAIDARVFDSLTGARSLNLALTGGYGFVGSLNMIRWGVKHHDLRAVIVMQTPEMMSRDISYGNFVTTAPNADLSSLPPTARARVAVSAAGLLVNLGAVPKTLWSMIVGSPFRVDPALDYVPQGPRHRIDPRGDYRYRAPANERHSVILEAISQLCKAHSITCIYVHGPWLWRYVDSSEDYLARTNQIIQTTGLALLAEQPLRIEDHEIGDSPDHVAPAFRRAFTTRFTAALLPVVGGRDAAGDGNTNRHLNRRPNSP